jgi:type I restriction enzyme S subunit
VAIARNSIATNQGFKSFVVKGGYIPEYLFYLLKASTAEIESNASGGTFAEISAKAIADVELPFPPFEHQRAISSLLSSLDLKMEINRSVSKTLKALAQALFKSWFIDFDPVKAKMAGEAPVGMDPETAALFPDSLEESELGEVPSGWVAQPLDSIADYLNGLALQKFPVVDDSDVLPVIKIAQLRAGHTRGADFASGSLDPRYVVEDGDILFSWSGTLEVEYWTGGRGALNQHLFKVSGNTVPDWFAYFATRSFLGEFRAIASSKATTMGHIQRRHLTEALLAVPPNDVLEQASRFIGPLVSLRTDLLKQNTTLGKLRDSLSPRLISGELEIPDEMLAE